jgi:hypothetical protein
MGEPPAPFRGIVILWATAHHLKGLNKWKVMNVQSAKQKCTPIPLLEKGLGKNIKNVQSVISKRRPSNGTTHTRRTQ